MLQDFKSGATIFARRERDEYIQNRSGMVRVDAT